MRVATDDTEIVWLPNARGIAVYRENQIGRIPMDAESVQRTLRGSTGGRSGSWCRMRPRGRLRRSTNCANGNPRASWSWQRSKVSETCRKPTASGIPGPGDTVMLGIRANHAAIENPDPDLLAAVDDFDPEHDALVLGPGFSRARHSSGVRSTAPGPRRGGRWRTRRSWTNSGTTQASAAPRRPSCRSEAPAAAADLASDLGTVWVADNSEGWHGAANLRVGSLRR